MESLDLEDKEDQRAPGDREDPAGQQENQEPREHQEVTAPLVHPARGDCPDPKEPTVSLGPKDLQDPQERMDCLDTPAREEKLVSKGRLDHLGLLELWDLRAPQVRQDRWASVATPDPQAHQESRVCLDPLGRRAPRETLVPPGAPARTDPQD